MQRRIIFEKLYKSSFDKYEFYELIESALKYCNAHDVLGSLINDVLEAIYGEMNIDIENLYKFINKVYQKNEEGKYSFKNRIGIGDFSVELTPLKHQLKTHEKIISLLLNICDVCTYKYSDDVDKFKYHFELAINSLSKINYMNDEQITPENIKLLFEKLDLKFLEELFYGLNDDWFIQNEDPEYACADLIVTLIYCVTFINSPKNI